MNRRPAIANRWCREIGIAILLASMLFSGLLAQLAQAGISLMPTASAHAALPGSSGTPNHFDFRTNVASSGPRHIPTAPANGPTGPQPPTTPSPTIARGFTPTMNPGAMALSATQASHFSSSDGRLDVDVPLGAVSAADVTVGGGALSLEVTEVAPPSGSNAGGSGHVSFGTYLFQVVDSQSVLAKQGLRKPITLTLHFGARDSAVDVAHAFVVLNGPLPVSMSSAPTTAPTVTRHQRGQIPSVTDRLAPGSFTRQQIGMGQPSSSNATLDPKAHTLTVAPMIASPSGTASWDTQSSVGSYGAADVFSANLNAGALGASIPIDVPAGPGGLTPPLSLSYSSAGVTESHNPQSAAGWVGEGWNLSLGSISWSESNSNATCGSGCGNGWENTWQLDDPFGTSTQLIPPNINVSTYFDDSPNSITPSPVQWQTAPQSYTRIFSYVGSVTPPDSNNTPAPCFRVFLPNGIMEEFGCTLDALEYYYSPAMGDFIYGWNLDLITDPHGNQIHVTYQQQQGSYLYGGVNHPYIQDAVLNTVEWDSPACHNAQTMCTGASWAPLMRVSFSASQATSRLDNTPTSPCDTASGARCDDPNDLSPTNLRAPEVQSTFALNDALTQVRSNGSGAWNTLKDYQFTYDQNGPGQITDPLTNKQESTAGRFLLTRLAVVGDDGATALPTRAFSYLNMRTYYEDSNYRPYSASQCGPVWNVGYSGSGCLLWSQSYEGNSYYLQSTSNGMGLQQAFDWTYGRNNTHGSGTGAHSDPYACAPISWSNGTPLSAPPATWSNSYPCNEADDQNWSRVLLAASTSTVLQATPSAPQTLNELTNYTYFLTYPLAAQECGDCAQGMYWGNQDDGDSLDYYNGKFMGFAEADTTAPDNSVTKNLYYSTQGYGIYDTSQVTCKAFTPPCHAAPWWNIANAAHGHAYEVDSYDTDGATLLGKAQYQYGVTCPPAGVAGSGSTPFGNFDGNLVSELDHDNPVAACAITSTQSDQYTNDGSTASGVPHVSTAYSYDGYGRVTSATDTSNNGGAFGSPTSTTRTTGYVWNDAVSANGTGATGTYIVDLPAYTYTKDSGSATHTSCSYYVYDSLPYGSGQQSGLTLGNLRENDHYTACGTDSVGPSGFVTTTYGYDTYGNTVGTADPDANQGNWAHKNCSAAGAYYTDCAAYDATFDTLPVASMNALNQLTSVSYANSGASGGFGLWPSASTDLNGQATSYSYDALGRVTSTNAPGETSAYTTAASYTYWCPAPTGANSSVVPQTACVEVDQTQRLDSGHTITARSFYDGLGRLVETRAPGPNGQDVVQYATYDSRGYLTFERQPYFVASYTGPAGAAAYVTPDIGSTPPGASYTYPSHLKTTATDALSNTTTTSESVVCAWPNLDAGCYVATFTVDALSHRSETLTDALGRVYITQVDTGTGTQSSPYAAYAITAYTFDDQGRVVGIQHPAPSYHTTFTYDSAGRMVASSDPDLGAFSYSYDPNGNVTAQSDARGAAGTVYAAYDGLNRPQWQSAQSSGASPLATWSYDSSAGGNLGVGRLTGETFASGPSQSVTGGYSYLYDARGRTTSTTMTLAGPTLASETVTDSATYDDADRPLSTTLGADANLPAETLSLGYDTSNGGVLTSLTSSLSSPTSTLFSGVGYTAAGEVTGWASGTTGGGTAWQAGMRATYDGDLRLATSNLSLTNATARTTTTIASVAPGYDAVSNVTSLTTTLAPVSGVSSGGSETQAFCYDDLNRLVWASTQASGSPCGRTGSEGVTNAGYTASYSYDLINDITSASVTTSGGAPLPNTAQGAYSYNTANAAGHLHAVSSVGGSQTYSAGYDAAGDMTCRAVGSLSCTTTGNPTGQSLTYDALRRLVAWQNATTSPTSSATYAYDGEGTRVWQQTTSGSGSGSFQSITTTAYLLGHDEQTTTQPSGQPATATATRYYPTPGGALLVRDASGLSYLATDALGTPIASVNLDSGAVLGEQLRAPYGEGRYAVAAGAPSGGMHSTVGFTGQREDTASSGLTYFNAREYDPAVGRFVSVDTHLNADPLRDGYAYVGGMVESAVDPSGHSVLTQTYSAGFDQQHEGELLYNLIIANPDDAFNLYLTDRPDWNLALAYGNGTLHNFTLETATGRGGMDFRLSHSAAYFADPAHQHDLFVAEGAEAWLIQETTGSTHDGHGDMNHLGGRGGDGGDGGGDSGDDGVGGLGSGITGDGDGVQGYADGRGGDGCGESFAPETPVQTPTGQQAIASLTAGETVEAYDPTTGTTSPQVVERVYIDHDSDLLDVTLRVQPDQRGAQGGAQARSTHEDGSLRVPGQLRRPAEATDRTTGGSTGAETIHTTASHPWLSADHGWVRAGQLTVGERVRRADGTTAVVVTLRVVPGVASMWDLTVSQVHTFAVGVGGYVVHNCGGDTSATDNPTTPASGNGDTPENVSAFGNKSGPRAPRAGTDIEVVDDNVSGQTPPGVKGASTFTDPLRTSLSGHYHTLPAGTTLPKGLGIFADGEDVGGTQPWGHRTIYPTENMTFQEFTDLFLSLPWQYGGKI